eukprot:TRINITY_DN4586_c0_g1_i1.p1 TRINITY_DN4586_c0_g1~~TRINITY_DN4586_c0_g1_i1.p1  ORF type:complete len:433 (-),score=121.36 TRINITY_DN4586_c0_g1_i1:28-1287(-)
MRVMAAHSALLVVVLCLVGFGACQKGITSPPFFGIYHGAAPSSPANFAAYEAWIGRPVIFGTDFAAIDDWSQLEGQGWLLGPWSQYMNTPSRYARNWVMSVGMLPQGSANSLLVNGANGQYNNTWQTLGRNLVKYNLTNTYIRLGWEFNGNWQPWRVGSYPTQWVKYWQVIVDNIRSIPGGNFKFIWCPNAGYAETDAITVYPGNSYVDIISIDSYDVSYNQYNNVGLNERGTFQPQFSYATNDVVDFQGAWFKSLSNQSGVYPTSSSWQMTVNSTILAAKRAAAWNENCYGFRGLAFWANYSKAAGKGLGISEWGVWLQERGGGDDAEYMRKMWDWINDAGNNVYYYSYFDVYAYDGDHGLGPGASGQLVDSAAVYKKLFGLSTSTSTASASASGGGSTGGNDNASPAVSGGSGGGGG